MIHELLRLSSNRNRGGISLDILLHLNALVVSKRTVCFGNFSITSSTDIFVIANSLFVEAVKNAVLIVSQTLYPSMHVGKHFSLDFGS